MHVSHGENFRTLTTMSPTETQTSVTCTHLCGCAFGFTQQWSAMMLLWVPGTPMSFLQCVSMSEPCAVEQVQVVNAATMFVIGNPTCCTGYEDHARWAAWCNAWLLIKLTPKGVLFSSLFFQEHDQCETKHQAHQSHLCCLFVDHKVEDMQLTCLTSVQALICQGV